MANNNLPTFLAFALNERAVQSGAWNVDRQFPLRKIQNYHYIVGVGGGGGGVGILLLEIRAKPNTTWKPKLNYVRMDRRVVSHIKI